MPLAISQALLDSIRDGFVKKERAKIPEDFQERANHLKAHCYFYDASQVAIWFRRKYHIGREKPKVGFLLT